MTEVSIKSMDWFLYDSEIRHERVTNWFYDPKNLSIIKPWEPLAASILCGEQYEKL